MEGGSIGRREWVEGGREGGEKARGGGVHVRRRRERRKGKEGKGREEGGR